MEEFAGAFGDADGVEILDIYAASEEPIVGITAAALAEQVGRRKAGVAYAASVEEAIGRLVGKAREGDVILTQGAGSVSGIAPLLLEALKAAHGVAVAS